MTFRKLVISLLLIFSYLPMAESQSLCHGKFPNPITDVCWRCIFPITIGAATLFHSKYPDTKNPHQPVCLCHEYPNIRIGISLGYWEPIALVDVTRQPFCMVNLGGIQLHFGDRYNIGKAETANPNQNSSFYYAHWYIFPLMYWINLITDAICVEKADFDIAYLTELDSTWQDEKLAFIVNPEALLFANPTAQAACATDSIQSAFSLPIDHLFWCAGSQGSMYPLAGYVQEHVGGVQASTLIAERMAYKMHREGLLWDSTSQGGSALCYQYPTTIIPKSRYRYQMINPIPTTGEHGCFPFGHTTADWGSNHEYPYQGEDFGYLIWRKRNCCAF